MSDILQDIVAHKRREVEAAKTTVPWRELEARVVDRPTPRDFVQALRDADRMGLIAEVKKASPSAGVIRPDFDPVAIARTYEAHGADCLSVLTDEHYFQGHLDYLTAIRRNVTLPLLRKDFIIDRYQVLEATAAGADCILLIAECLDNCQLRDLYFYADELGMECLVELYDPQNLPGVLELGCPLIGINNRNLRTMQTDLRHTLELVSQVPDETLLVSESGIRTAADVRMLSEQGVAAILVGESLMRQPEIGTAVDQLMAIRGSD